MCAISNQLGCNSRPDAPSAKAEAPFQRVELWLLLQESLRAEHCGVLVDTGVLADIPVSAVKMSPLQYHTKTTHHSLKIMMLPAGMK